MKHVLQLALALFSTTVTAQRLTVVIDPARGGTEYGARIDAQTYEKQVTLDLASRLKSLLAARDFDVVMTRESDVLVTNDQRAAIANQAKPVACLLLHSTGSGTGVHLFTSSLAPSAPSPSGILWDEAQAPYVQRSARLQADLATALSRSKLAVSRGHTWIRPLDNMSCPALTIEIAPENASTNAADRGYQTRIADAIASAVLLWRSHADVMQSIVAPAPAHEPPAAAPVAIPRVATPATAATSTNGTGKPAVVPAAPSAGTAKPAVRKSVPSPKPVPATSSPEAEGGAPQ